MTCPCHPAQLALPHCAPEPRHAETPKRRHAGVADAHPVNAPTKRRTDAPTRYDAKVVNISAAAIVSVVGPSKVGTGSEWDEEVGT